MMVSLYYVIQEMHSFSMRPSKYFYDEPLPKYLDLKTVLIYRPHPVQRNNIQQLQERDLLYDLSEVVRVSVQALKGTV